MYKRQIGKSKEKYAEYQEFVLASQKKALDLKARFDEAGVPFAAMDLTVQPPRAEDGQRPDGEIRVEGFPCDAIVPDGLVDRIREADQELEEYYAQEDAERKRQEAALSQ